VGAQLLGENQRDRWQECEAVIHQPVEVNPHSAEANNHAVGGQTALKTAANRCKCSVVKKCMWIRMALSWVMANVIISIVN